MSGIILFLILAVWFYAVKKMSGICVAKMQPGAKKIIINYIIFALIFVAPLADEIVGGFQFRSMCTQEKLLIYDPEKIRDKSVVHGKVSVKTINKIIPIVITTGQWEDSETGELLITRYIFRAKGGWLSRLIGFPQGSPPYTFSGVCSSKEYHQLFEKLNITKIEN